MESRFSILEEEFSETEIGGYIVDSQNLVNEIKKYTVTFKKSDGSLSKQVFLGRCQNVGKPLIVWFHGWIDNALSFYDINPVFHEHYNILSPRSTWPPESW